MQKSFYWLLNYSNLINTHIIIYDSNNRVNKIDLNLKFWAIFVLLKYLILNIFKKKV